MPRLVVNPGAPTAWEIQLKPGANFIGRGFANDFKLPDASVSGSHCQIIVSDLAVVIRDLGSTNGTFVNRSRIQEVTLQSGQTIHLGGVEMLFQANDSAAVDAAPARVAARTTAAAPIAVVRTTIAAPVAASAAAGVALASAPVAAAPPPAFRLAGRPPGTGTVAVAPPPLAPPIAAPAAPGSTNCKFHPKTPGRYLCNHCQHYFCELCVTARAVGGAQKKFCRHCGNECIPVQVQIARPTGPQGFFPRLPGAFIYPFKGSGLLVLIVSTLLLASMAFISAGIFALLTYIVALGYLFSYMQNIIHATANEEAQMPELPGFDDVFGGAFRLAATVVISFGVPIALFAVKFFTEADIPTSAVIATMVLGCLYFPMAFLAVAMKDSALAANPLVVFPAIMKVPAGYLVTTIIVIGVYGLRTVGDMVTAAAKAEGYHTRDMSTLFMTFGLRAFWALASVYLLTVSMRVLGLLYVTNKRKFGWFDR